MDLMNEVLARFLELVGSLAVVVFGLGVFMGKISSSPKEWAEWLRELSAGRIQEIFPRSVGVPPGHRLLAFAEFFYSRTHYEEVLEPTIHDMRDEYNEALAAGHRMKARWVRIRGTWSFFCAAGLTKVWSALKTIHKIVTK